MEEKYFQFFLKCLKKAIKKIDTHYIQLSVADSDEPIYRERVYCYELYHQLRCILGDAFPYKLDGELDKKSHICYPNGEKPDFVIHIPGKMEQNLVVIEVKKVLVKDHIKELRKDFDKLKMFISNDNYYRAIMLIYGNVNGDLPQNIKKEIESVRGEHILVLWHYELTKEPKIISGEKYVD